MIKGSILSLFSRGSYLSVLAVAVLSVATVQPLRAEVEPQDLELESLQGLRGTQDGSIYSLEQEPCIVALTERVEQLERRGEYAPQVFGAIMAYSNISTYNGDMRFNVRFSRFGIRGRVANNVTYLSQVDFSAQGNLLVLDAYVKYANAKGNFDFTVGQQLVHYNSNIDRGPASCLFMSRSFCAIYLLNYTSYNAADGSYASAFMGARDIGAAATYTFRLGGEKGVPVMVGGGMFNGDGINNPQWRSLSEMSYLARLQIGGVRGLSGGVNVYYGNTQLDQEIEIFSAELRYRTERLFIESIYAQRRLRANLGEGPLDLFQGLTLQGYYTIPTPRSKAFKSISPLLRWDGATGISYLDANTSVPSTVNAYRITPAINIAMKGEKARTRLSIAYEKVFTEQPLQDLDNNYALVDRVTLGFTVVF